MTRAVVAKLIVAAGAAGLAWLAWLGFVAPRPETALPTGHDLYLVDADLHLAVAALLPASLLIAGLWLLRRKGSSKVEHD